jgi:hypothetical protein
MFMNDLKITQKLVNADQLLEALFTPEARPSKRWIREQTNLRTIPFVRIGRLIFFDVELVRAHLAGKMIGRRHF